MRGPALLGALSPAAAGALSRLRLLRALSRGRSPQAATPRAGGQGAKHFCRRLVSDRLVDELSRRRDAGRREGVLRRLRRPRRGPHHVRPTPARRGRVPGRGRGRARGRRIRRRAGQAGVVPPADRGLLDRYGVDFLRSSLCRDPRGRRGRVANERMKACMGGQIGPSSAAARAREIIRAGPPAATSPDQHPRRRSPKTAPPPWPNTAPTNSPRAWPTRQNSPAYVKCLHDESKACSCSPTSARTAGENPDSAAVLRWKGSRRARSGTAPEEVKRPRASPAQAQSSTPSV